MLDMFYLYPAASLTNGKRFPQLRVPPLSRGHLSALVAAPLWNPSVDNVVSQLAMADGCLHKEVGQ